MNLFRILPLVVGSAAFGILCSTSPASALTWTANDIQFDDGGTLTGSFNFTGGLFSNINLTLTGAAISGGLGTTGSGSAATISFTSPTQVTFLSNSSTLFLTDNGAVAFGRTFFNLEGINLNIFNTSTTPTSGAYGRSFTPGNQPYVSGTLVNVPFDIPGGASIPTVGSLVALGLMRTAKKRIAQKQSLPNL